MNVLPYNEINAACLTVVDGSPFYSQFLADAMEVLYLSGCRPVELLDLARWSKDSGSIYKMQPTKGNNVRTIDVQEFPDQFQKWLVDGLSNFRLYTYYSGQNFFKHTWPQKPCYVGNKRIDQYIFRHRFVKSLVLAGKSTAEIQTIMGWTTDAMVQRYSNSIVYY